MRRAIKDADTKILAQIAGGLRVEYEDYDDLWRGSPFAWIKTRPSRQVGKIGEQLIAEWCAARDMDVVRSPDSEADRIIEDQRVEIKFSTLWKDEFYMFQQIRDQNYDTLLCLGVSPFEAHAWIIKKKRHSFRPSCASAWRRAGARHMVAPGKTERSTRMDAEAWRQIVGDQKIFMETKRV